jgi:hypothetical protein
VSQVYEILWTEMLHARVGLPDTDGNVHIYQTSAGMKDGVWGTSFWGVLAKIVGELHKIWRLWGRDQRVRDAYTDVFDVVRSIKAEIHGDNSLVAYPASLACLAPNHPEAVAWEKEIGLDVKPEESLVTDDLGKALCMSWQMANIGTNATPRIVGWKRSPDLLKAFFLPERLADYDAMSLATRDYLGQILVSLYILGYWNLSTRKWLEVVWHMLWNGQPEETITLTKMKDFIWKTGMDPRSIAPVRTTSPFPFPPELVAELWLGATGHKYVDRYVREASTEGEAAAFVNGLAQLRETQFGQPAVEEGEWAPAQSDND